MTSCKNFDFIILLLVVEFTGTLPYLELNARLELTMFNNLKVEENKTNHFVIPRLLPNSFANNLVTIINYSNLTLARDSQSGIKGDYIELQRKLC